MQHYNYIIIGGGMTADSAVKGIRKKDAKGSIALISNEDNAPYNRPPLSKALWKGDPEESIWRKTNENNISLILNRMVTSVDTKEKTIKDNVGNQYSYDKLLFATGCVINRLSFDVPGIIYYRTLDDYKKLRVLLVKSNHILVIGGGFIGSELAASLAMNENKVTMIFPDAAIGSRVYPPALSAFLNAYYEEKGVTLIPNDTVTSVKMDTTGYHVQTGSGKSISADVIIAGIGVKPDVELAKNSGLNIENGITVDEHLHTSAADVYAAGDVANFHSRILGKRIRVEHEDNANVMGEMAGSNMAGGNENYDYMPFFYSDLFDLGYEAVGELDSRLDVVEEWKELFREGVVYYLRDGLVRGVLLWNTWGQIDNARSLINEKGPFTRENLKGRLPVS